MKPTKYFMSGIIQRVEYASDKCIHHLFEEQVMRSPDAIAVVYEGDQATYSELNATGNRLAHYLVNKGQEKIRLLHLSGTRY